MTVTDKNTKNDNDIVTLDSQFQKEYNQIVEAFNNRHCVMVLFKNITINQTEDQYLRINASTIISIVVDNFVQKQLKAIHGKLYVMTQTPSKEVCILTNPIFILFISFFTFIFIKCNN